MYESTALRVNVLGDMNKCNTLPNASYALLHFGNIGIGICGPESCSSNDYLMILSNPTIITEGLGGLSSELFERVV